MGDFMPHFTISTIKISLIYILSRKIRRKKLLMCTFCPATRHRPLPAGMEVFVSIYHTHRMPELYPKPARFHPRRWESIEPSIFEYNPFSAGPRLCLGWQFALQEMKVVLALLMQRIRLRCVPKLVINRTGVIVLTPEGGLPMIIHAQDRLFQHGVGGVRGNVRDMVELPP